jgi:hypothetical protein
MKQLLLALLSLAIGVYVGWYFGYTRPVTKGYRELKDALHLTDMPDKQMAEAGAQIRDHMPEFLERMKRSDDMTTALALAAYSRVDQGNIDGAKNVLLPYIGRYYRHYHTSGGDQKILASIEEAGQKHPEIAAEIAKKQ